MNGIKLESDERFHSSSSGTNGSSSTCCLLDNGQRCTQPYGNAGYNKRIAKMVQQRRLKLSLDSTVRIIYALFKYILV
jgi:histone deacetylase complex subunit SAP30